VGSAAAAVPRPEGRSQDGDRGALVVGAVSVRVSVIGVSLAGVSVVSGLSSSAHSAGGGCVGCMFSASSLLGN
jgi:hypothetical protein